MAVLAAPAIDFGGTDEPLSQGILIDVETSLAPSGGPPTYTRELLTTTVNGGASNPPAVGYPL